MLDIISNAAQLERYYKQFMEGLEQTWTNTIHSIISYRPSSEEADVKWSDELSIWWYSKLIGNRWWSTFGIGRPLPYSTLGIAVEINIPTNGVNRNIAGGFAKKDDGVFVVHRGNRLGGGKQGITKELFWTNFRLRSDNALDGDRMARVAMVCQLGSSRLPYEVAEFVHEVVRIKRLA